MCKYCEKLEKNKQQEALLENDLFVVQVDTDTPIGRRRDEGSTLRIFDNIDETIINIFYCPMCGRKLNGSSSKSKYIIADDFLDIVPGGDKGKIMKKMYPNEKFDTPQDFLRKVDFNCDWETLESFMNNLINGDV